MTYLYLIKPDFKSASEKESKIKKQSPGLCVRVAELHPASDRRDNYVVNVVWGGGRVTV